MIVLKNLFAYSVEKLQLISFLKRFGRSKKNKAAILAYHDIGKTCKNIRRLDKDIFYKQINWLNQNTNIVSLNEIVTNLYEGKNLGLKVALTFDDGYKSFISEAYPILESLQIPATVFATIDFLNGEIPWYVKISCILCKTENKMTKYRLNGDYLQFDWNQQASLDFAYKKLKRYFGTKNECERNELLDNFANDFNVNEFDSVKNNMMSWDHLKLLRGDLVDIGCHSFSHPFLVKMNPAQLQREVVEAHKLLEERLKSPIKHFCYPTGEKNDFDSTTVMKVKEAGFKSACTSEFGYVKLGDTPFMLKRIYTSEPYLAKFAWRIP